MQFLSILKSILIYKEPKKYNQFELLEDEPEEVGKAADANYDSANQTPPPRKEKSKWRSKISELIQREPKPESNQAQDDSAKVDKKLQVNLERVKSEFNAPTNQDVVIREFKVMQQNNAFIVYIDGMADKITVNDYILRQLMERHGREKNPKSNTVDYIVNNLLSANQVTEESDFNQILQQVLNGLTALFIQDSAQCILIESRGYEKRDVSTPLNETVIRGPQEAFVENLRTNITLVRRIIRNKDLVTEMIPVGKTNNMTCALLYIKGVTNPKIIQEVKRRINSIDIDFIAASGVLEQLIEDHPYAIFPQILSTERPDRAASFLMEGKVAIICDGTPYASVVPVTIYHFFHTSEDYTQRWQYGTFLRIVRVVAALFAMLLPGLYIALTLFHQEMIPTELLSSLAKARENIPFPTILEILLMEISFELIREAGIRVPGVIGQTLGIIGGVILGQAAVAAGLVSPVLIIIVSITGLGSFAIPSFSFAFGIRLIRFLFIFLGAIAGFYGIAIGIFIFGGLACSMKSFGVPYFSPVAPKTKSTQDTVIRTPTWMQKDRPDFLNPVDRARAGKVVRGWADQSKTGDGQ